MLPKYSFPRKTIAAIAAVMFSGCRWGAGGGGGGGVHAWERQVILLMVNGERLSPRQNLGSMARIEGICEHLGLVSLGE